MRGYASIAAGTIYSAISREDIPDDLHSDLKRMKERYDYQRHGDMHAEHAGLITDRIVTTLAERVLQRYRRLTRVQHHDRWNL